MYQHTNHIHPALPGTVLREHQLQLKLPLLHTLQLLGKLLYPIRLTRRRAFAWQFKAEVKVLLLGLPFSESSQMVEH